ncbi:predicted protein [Nematostella vectensis]|uniref:Probable G-protein coupled receptor 19 n=2 Tax=Nematostella vectensis TaxID=45351 RepID=A7S4A0_NEMVE|nr:predicted protein [Nematostella vectensis]|eukprot:XP_001633543.1 predicted protein [Nematostella vectensis]
MAEDNGSRAFNLTRGSIAGTAATTASVLVVTAFLGFVSLGGVFGNGLVVCVIKRLRWHGKQSSVHTFLLHLALSDLMVCCVCIPLTITANFVALDSSNTLHSIVCKTMRFFQFLAPTVSISLLTVISIDRFLVIVKPLRKTFLRRSTWLIIFAWTYSIIQFLPTFYLARIDNISIDNSTVGYCTPIPNNTSEGLGYLMFLAFCAFVLPLTTMCVMYTSICRVVWRRHEQLHDNSTAISGETLFRRSKRRILKMLLIVVAAFMFCWLPFVAYAGFVEPYLETFPNPGDLIRLASYCLGLTNSLINPVIYFFSNVVLRKSCIDLLCCRKFNFPANLQYAWSPAISRRMITSRGSSLIPDISSLRHSLHRR